MKETEFISKLILDKIAKGDRNAFRSFYNGTYPTVYRYIRYFLSIREDCEEAVSEVYFIVWKQRETLAHIQDVKAWLYIVSRNEAYQRLKQKEKNKNLSIDDIPIDLYVDRNAVEEELIEHEMLELYDNAIKELPERCKLIFLMVREEHLTYKEIAEILSISVGTVEQQMSNAIRKIAAIVKQFYPSLGKRK